MSYQNLVLGLGAVVGGIEGWVSFEEDVEAGAEGFVVAVFGAKIYIVGVKSFESEICVC